MRVRVYRNLRTGGYSVQARRSNRRKSWFVVGHAKAVLLSSAKFIVLEGGRARVLREKRKNVHAFVEGDFADAVALDGHDCPTGDGSGAWGTDAKETRRFGMKIAYNPYKAGHFFFAESGDALTKVNGAGGVLVNERGIEACYTY